MIDNNVLRLDISVHDASTMTIVKSLQKFKQIETNLHICHPWNERSEVNIIEVIKHLNQFKDTSEIDLEAGSRTTSLSSIIPGCPLRAFRIFISLLILVFLTGLSTLTTTFESSAIAMPMYTSEYFPFPILVTI